MRPTLALLAGSVAAASSGPKCTDGLQVFVARGTGEDPGVGLSSAFTDGIAKKIKNTNITPIDYPASFDHPSYFESVQNGTDAVIKAVRDYAKKCPNGKMAYLGYSQGAQIGSEAFCGPSDPKLFGDDTAISANIVNDNIVAIVLYGDPTHKANVTYDKGTSKQDGIFPRSSVGKCKDYKGKLQSYCDDNDYYCDSGKSHEVHGSYFKRYQTQIVDFVVKQYKQSQKDVKPASNNTSGGNGNNGNGNSGNGNSGNGNGGKTDGGKSAAAGLTAAKGLLVAAPLAAMAVLL